MITRRFIKVACWVVYAAVVVGVLMSVRVHTLTRRICVLCRVEQGEQRLFGFNWQSFKTNEFTLWHDSHRPAHDHVWSFLGTRGRNVFGQTMMWGCGPTHPISRVPLKMALEFVQQSDDSTVGLRFERISSEDAETQRLAAEMIWESWIENRSPAPN